MHLEKEVKLSMSSRSRPYILQDCKRRGLVAFANCIRMPGGEELYVCLIAECDEGESVVVEVVVSTLALKEVRHGLRRRSFFAMACARSFHHPLPKSTTPRTSSYHHIGHSEYRDS